MKLRKMLITFALVAALSCSCAMPAFAVTVAKDSTQVFKVVEDKLTCKDASGHPVTGWVNYDGAIYYMNKKGVMRSGWIIVDNNCYYCYQPDDKVDSKLIGTLATDTWIDNYYVDKEGVWTKTR